MGMVKKQYMLDLSGELGTMYMNDLVYFAESKHGILTVQISARVGLLISFSSCKEPCFIIDGDIFYNHGFYL